MNSINLLILSLSIYILIKAMTDLRDLLPDIHFSGLRSFFSKKEEASVEEPIEEYIKPKYDVQAFQQRIQRLKDEDGLYDIVDEPIPDDFTGAEIITEMAESDIDYYLSGRK